MLNHTPKNTYYALRHGRSEKNDLGLVVSYPEAQPYHLTELGRNQVSEGAQWLKDKAIDMIIASDLTRTTESAQIVADVLGLTVTFDERLREMDMGVYNNKTHDEYHSFYTNARDPEERFERAPEGGETWKDVTVRMLSFLQDMEMQYEGKNILLVSHGDPLWLLQWGSQCLSILGLNDVPYPETGKPMKLEITCAPQTHMFIR